MGDGGRRRSPASSPLRSVMPSASVRPYIGGQAVLEGVMMRSPKSFAVVVRRRDGTLYVRERAAFDAAKGVVRWPFVRGIATLVESLRLGGEALRFSVEQVERDMASESPGPGSGTAGTALGVLAAIGRMGAFGVALLGAALRSWGLALAALASASDEAPRATAPAARSGGRNDAPNATAHPTPSGAPNDAPNVRPHAQRSGAGGYGMLIVAVAFFVALPQLAAAGISRLFGLGLPVQSAGFQAITGVLKLAIVVGYLLAIRRIPEIRRVFQYHGAEHKTISTYEAGERLTVANARAKTTLHPRCGTTFLVMVAIVSVLVFTALGAMMPRIQTGSVLLDNLVFFAEKLPFLPVLVAVTFELQRLFARYCATGPLRILLWPGFMVQRITTAEPDDHQIEVALASLRVTLFRQEAGADPGGSEGDVAFANYDELLVAATLRAT